MGLFTRGEKQEPARYRAARPITSAATPVRLRDRSELEKIRNRAAVSHAWQTEAWRVYNNLGEINFAFNLIATAFSRIRFHAAVMLNPDEPPTEVADAIALDTGTRTLGAPSGVHAGLAVRARELVAELNKGHGLPTLQRSYALNRQVAGECYLCLIEEQWSVKSTFELLVDPGGGMRLQPSVSTTTQMPRELPKGSAVWRMWTMHPMYSLDPDCSLRSVLYLCEQLIKLNRMISNTIASRMNAGILQVATEILEAARTPGQENAVDETATEETEPFLADLNATMTQPIQDDQAGAGVIPMVAAVPYSMMADGIKHLMLARDIDQHMLTYAQDVLGRILNGISIPKDAITGYQNVRYCADTETEVLTRDGWVTYDQLSEGDLILSLNHTTGLSEWQPVQEVATFDVADEPMLRVEHRGHSSLTTMDHRWPVLRNTRAGRVREWRTSGTLGTADNFVVAAPSAELPVEQKYTDAFVELLGWFWTEGSVTASRACSNRAKTYAGRVRRRWGRISQSERVNPQHVAAIRRALTELYGPAAKSDPDNPAPAWFEYHKPPGQIDFMLNEEAVQPFVEVCPGPAKIINPGFVLTLTAAQLDLFIRASIDADGHHHRDGSAAITQSVDARLDALELACVLRGVPTHRHVSQVAGRPDAYRLKLKKRVICRPNRGGGNTAGRYGTVLYTGVVWCPTVANGTWLARRHGTVYYTGNTNAQQISQDLYTQAVEPLALAFADDITDIYLRPMLRQDIKSGAGWDPEQVEKMVVWYDPSEIMTRPDRGADADAGWDRDVLSDSAWRKSHGYGAEDAPSEEETIKRTMLRGAQWPPNLVDYVARKLWPEYFADAPELETKAAAGMAEDATEPLGATPGRRPPPVRRNPANNLRPRAVPGQAAPAGTEDQDTPPGGTLPPRRAVR